MAIFDGRLIDPSERDLAAALGKAMRAANRENKYQQNRMSRDAAFWGRFAQDVLRSSPEGRRRSCKGGRAVPEVIAGWWTDPAGRKHVRVVGRTRRQYNRMRGEVELRGLPPWWHVYPEAVLGVRGKGDKGGERYIAVCRCGAVGTPESLGWMGNTCGPCFDRLADGGPVAGGYGQFSGWSAHLSRFGFTPDGRLIGPSLTGAFRVVNRADGSAVTGRRRIANQVAAVAANGTGAVIALHDGGVYRWSDATGDIEPVLHSRRIWGRVSLAANGSRLVLLSYQQSYSADLTAAHPQYARHPALEGFYVLRYTPDGSRLLGTTFSGELRAVDLARGTSDPVRTDAFADLPGGYAPPNEFVLNPEGTAALVRRQSYHPARVLVRHVPLAGGRALDLRVPDGHHPATLAYSPDGQHAVTVEAQTGWVGFWEVASGKALGFVRVVLEDQAWGGGQVEFAPDGRAVAVSYSTGHHEHGSTIAVWPWPEVLGASGSSAGRHHVTSSASWRRRTRRS
jgi:hypothetical protein